MHPVSIDVVHIPFSRYTELAREIAYRYCRMSRERAKGNYENLDALTGVGRRAPGYTWAAGVYLMLRREYGC